MNKKTKIWLVVPLLLVIAVFIAIKARPKTDTSQMTKEISPFLGSIHTVISTTGTVLPKNRLEIKPPVNGRVESVLVKEGQYVKAGQLLAWMSSTERAALLDAARGQGKEQLEYWEQAYKPIALLASIDAEVIVATTQPGQTVTTADAVIVLSDHLIARAQVDETDIGKVMLGQKTVIIIDAYPDDKISAVVEHIYYESKTVNNVTIYEVDLVPEQVPSFFRSGMNATIDFIDQSKDNALLLPVEAIYKDKDGDFVLLKKNGEAQALRQAVQVGISDDKNTEIISGISVNDKVVVKNAKFVLPTSDVGSSPFTPFGQRKNSNGKK